MGWASRRMAPAQRRRSDMARVLNLDLGTNTGWAFRRPGGPIRHGSHRLVSGPVGDDLGRALSAHYDWLHDMISMIGPTHLVWEAPMAMEDRSQNTEILLFGYANVTELVGYRRHLQLYQAHVNHVRATVLGTARDGKVNAWNFCREQGWDPIDDNAADALVLSEFSAAEFEIVEQVERAFAR